MTKREFITKRGEIISEMLNNPSKRGIYPIAKCFKKMDKLFDKIMLEFTTHCNDLIDEKSKLQHKHDLALISMEQFCERMANTGLIDSYREFQHLIETSEV